MNFDDGPGAHGRHARRAAHNVGLLNRGVKNPAFPVLLGQQRGFAEYPAQSAAHVLAIKQGLRKFPQNIVHGVQRGVHHQGLIGTSGVALAGFLGYCGRREFVVGKSGGVGIGRRQGRLPIGPHRGPRLGCQDGKLVFQKTLLQELAVQAGQRVLLLVAGEVVAVPLAAHAAGVVAQQRALGMHQHRTAPVPNVRKRLRQALVRGAKIGPVHLHAVQTGEAGGKLVGIHGPHFPARGRDAPVVVLHQVHDGQLMEHGHLQGFGHFALGHGPVADGAQRQRLGVPAALLALGRCYAKTLLFEVLDGVGHAGGRNGLHARGRTLVGYHRHARAPQRRVGIVRAPPAERVIGLGQQLQHQLIRAQAQAQQQGIVAVVRSGVVGFGEQESGGQLHGFVAASRGVHVPGSGGFLLFVKRGHGRGRVHQTISAAQ